MTSTIPLLPKLKRPDFTAASKRGAYVYCYLRWRSSAAGKAGTPYYIGIATTRDRALSKYHNAPVPQNPALVRILRSGLTWSEACSWEQFYISHYGRVDIGTGCLRNLTDGGEGAPGVKRTPEQLQRYSLASSKKRHTPETKQLLSELRRGQTLSDETKEKISLACKGTKQSEEWVEKRIASHRGRKRSAETCELIRQKAIGRKSPGVASANSRRVWDSAARQRQSEASKAAWQRRKQLLQENNNDK